MDFVPHKSALKVQGWPYVETQFWLSMSGAGESQVLQTKIQEHQYGQRSSLAAPLARVLHEHASEREAGGSFEMRDGVVSVFGLEYQNVKLPVVVTEAHKLQRLKCV
eukprot:4457103-Amphidinium_carterae.1